MTNRLTMPWTCSEFDDDDDDEIDKDNDMVKKNDYGVTYTEADHSGKQSSSHAPRP